MAQPRNPNLTKEERMLHNVRQFKLMMQLAADEVENASHNRWIGGQFRISQAVQSFMKLYWREMNKEIWKGLSMETKIPDAPEEKLDATLLPAKIMMDERNLRSFRYYKRQLQAAGEEVIDMRVRMASQNWIIRELARELLGRMKKFWERLYMEVWEEDAKEEYAVIKALERGFRDHGPTPPTKSQEQEVTQLYIAVVTPQEKNTEQNEEPRTEPSGEETITANEGNEEKVTEEEKVENTTE